MRGSAGWLPATAVEAVPPAEWVGEEEGKERAEGALINADKNIARNQADINAAQKTIDKWEPLRHLPFAKRKIEEARGRQTEAFKNMERNIFEI